MDKYVFVTCTKGQVSKTCNEWADKGYVVDSWEIQANHAHIMLILPEPKTCCKDDPVVEEKTEE